MGPGTVGEPCAVSSRSPAKSVGEKRNMDDDLDGDAELDPKRIKMRDLQSVLRSEGTKAHDSECINGEEQPDHASSNGNGASQNTKITESIHSHKHQLSVGGPGLLPSPKRSSVAPSMDKCDVVMPTLPEGVDREQNTNMKSSKGLDLDLNATDNTGVEHNPFYPYKKLEHVIPTDPSECGSTTGRLEESEPLKKWKEMKQNGFLSSSHGGIPLIPRQYSRQSKRRKDDEQKRKMETTKTIKKELPNRFTRTAAPSGLLSGLNPGIINHVRNKKQVHSIIEAIVRSEKTDDKIHMELGRENGEVEKKVGRSSLSSSRLFSFSVPECSIATSNLDLAEERYRSGSVSSQLTSGSDDEKLTLKLSTAGTMASENASCMPSEYISVNQESVTALSLQASAVASQWLQLLYHDTNGRLGALRRSRKRVRNVQKQLPYLLSMELSSNQEENRHFCQSADAGSSNLATSNVHIKRWKALFNQMDKSLTEEGKYLERLLEQVKEMQEQCEKGQKSLNGECLSFIGASDDTRLKQEETLHGEYAVRAAAASIYSTCNLIMTAENVPCF